MSFKVVWHMYGDFRGGGGVGVVLFKGMPCIAALQSFYTCIYYILIFALKHRLWVVVRTKIYESEKKNPSKSHQFYSLQTSLHIA